MRPALALPALPLAALLALVACAERPAPIAGLADYQSFCTACHGASGVGDGPLAAQLDPPPADLTRIAARNGGVFPMNQVMSTIDGYTRGQHPGAEQMPEFGELLSGQTVLYDDGQGGNPVPVPARLLALAEYVKSLQE